MSAAQLAGILYDALKDDPVAVASIRDELKSLALSIATDPSKGREIVSATVNGQSYAATSTLTALERVGMLRIFLAGVDAGVRPSTRTYARI